MLKKITIPILIISLSLGCDDDSAQPSKEETAERTVVHAVEFPRPAFTTPPARPNKEDAPHFEPPKRPENTFSGRRKTRSLIRGASVHTSSDPVGGSVERVIDGERFSADRSSALVLKPGKQTVTIELPRTGIIDAIVVWFDQGDRAHYYRDVIVEIGVESNYSDFVQLFNNDSDGSELGVRGEDKLFWVLNSGKIISGGRRKAKYIRLTTTGDNFGKGTAIAEIEVFGTVDDTDA